MWLALLVALQAPEMRGFQSDEDIRLGVEGHYGSLGWGVFVRGEGAQHGMSRFGVAHYAALGALTLITAESRMLASDWGDLNWVLSVFSRGFSLTGGSRGDMGFGGGVRGRWLSLYPFTPYLLSSYQMMPAAATRPVAHGFRAFAGGEVQVLRHVSLGFEGGYFMLGTDAQPVWNGFLTLSL